VAPAVDRISVEMSQHYWYVDSAKARRELDFEPRDPQETLIDTIRYLRKHFLQEDAAGADWFTPTGGTNERTEPR
jgi:dihydroflavonol-4-reductase